MKFAIVVVKEFRGFPKNHVLQVVDSTDKWSVEIDADIVKPVIFDDEIISGSFLKAIESSNGLIIVSNIDGQKDVMLQNLRIARQNLLLEADISINKLDDTGMSSTAFRQYRQQLRDVTENFKNPDGSISDSILSVDLNSILPKKPIGA